MKCEQIHETVIRDIVDVLSDIKGSDEIKWMRDRKSSYSSIANASSALTVVFPVVVDRSLKIENAAMLTKSIERKATSMLQMLFSAIQVADSSDAFDYIKKFHTNLKMDSDISVDDFIDFVDNHALDESSGIQIVDKALYEAVKQDLCNLNYFLPDSVKEESIGERFSIIGDKVILTEAPTSNGGPYDNFKNATQANKNTSDIFKTQILDSDVKKANELIPTMMIVNFISKDKTSDTTPMKISNVIIGIKAKMYIADSMDIANRIVAKNNDNNGLLKLVRATTREISFFKDFLLAIDKAKIDALSNSNRGSSNKLWKVLERRSVKSKLRRGFSHVNDACAITTLVVSQEVVEYLKKAENINVEKEGVIRSIMESYNLMGFCIVDETQEFSKFLFDTGADLYETVSFNQLERESGDGSTKKIVNLMSKLNR